MRPGAFSAIVAYIPPRPVARSSEYPFTPPLLPAQFAASCQATASVCQPNEAISSMAATTENNLREIGRRDRPRRAELAATRLVTRENMAAPLAECHHISR